LPHRGDLIRQPWLGRSLRTPPFCVSSVRCRRKASPTRCSRRPCYLLGVPADLADAKR